jgi:hypothetical protein
MTFLAYGALFGALAISIPIAIHLLNKFQVRKVQWAAMRFILESMQRNQRRVQMKDLILLLVRCLLIILLALAFARPVFFQTGSGEGDSINAVILIDDSMSMSYSVDGKSNFDRAREAALKVVDGLKANSHVALYHVSDRVKEAVSPPTTDVDQVRRLIQSAQVTNRASDLWPGVKDAIDTLQRIDGSGKVFIITDDQKLAWRHSQEILNMQDQTRGAIAFQVISVGEEDEQNVSVSSLQVQGSIPVANQNIRVKAGITNWGSKAVSGLKADLTVDHGGSAAVNDLEPLAPGQTATVSFQAHFQDSGFHSLTVSIPPDHLTADDHRSVALEVLKDLHVLVVDGGTAINPIDGDGFYLASALLPIPVAQQSQYFLKVKTGQPSDLEKPLDSYRIIFLANVGQISPVAVTNLAAFVKDGGGLAIFPGEKTSTEFYNATPGFSALLPARLSSPETVPDHRVLALQSRGFTHPLTTFWNSQPNGDLGTIHFTRYCPLTLKAPSDDAKKNDSAPQVVANYSNGKPAIVSQEVGKGRVVLFGAAATPVWGNLPLQPSFVPLIYRLVTYFVKRNDGGRILDPGAIFSEELPVETVGKEFFVHEPGDTVDRRSGGHVELDQDKARLRFSDTEIPGAYEIFLGDSTQPLVTFAVQTRPEESDLSRIAPETELGSNSKKNAGASSRTIHATADLWLPFFCVAFLAALAEMLLVYFFTRRR